MKPKFFILLLFLCSCSGNKFIEYYEPVTAVSAGVFPEKQVVRRSRGRGNRHSAVFPEKQVRNIPKE